MKLTKYGLKICTGILLVISFILTFTVSDYYIFNRIGEFGFVFVFSQWVKKAGLLILPLAVYYERKSSADIAKYALPVFVIISCFTFGDFFNATAVTPESTPAQIVFAHINEFIPKKLNCALFFISNALYLLISGGLFIRDGMKANLKSFAYLPVAIVLCTPYNIFENFFNIENFPEGHFLRFKSFTVWHFAAVAALFIFTVCVYVFLKGRDERSQNEYLAALAIVLLIQYHSKDSMVMGDGYNAYSTVFACIPLFICNLGVYVCSLAIFLKKKTLYGISFFVHASGAFSIFFYFATGGIYDYGIFCSYSALYYVFTHCLLFALAIMPVALGRYKLIRKHRIIALIYYFAVIFTAFIASALLTSASMEFSYGGYTLTESERLLPNYAFTQINPLPFSVPEWKITVWRCDFNLLYLIGLYAFYVGIFYSFYGAYKLFCYVRDKIQASCNPPCP